MNNILQNIRSCFVRLSKYYSLSFWKYATKNRSISDSLLPSLTGFIATEKLRITAISR